MFSERFKQERKRLKLTQDQIAKKLKISRSNVANWENGSNLASPDMIVNCAKLFNCSTDYLLGQSEYRNSAEEYDILFKDELPGLRNSAKILGSLDQNIWDELKLDEIKTLKPIDFNTIHNVSDIPPSNATRLLNELEKMNILSDNKDISQEELNTILKFIENNKDMLKSLIEKEIK